MDHKLQEDLSFLTDVCHAKNLKIYISILDLLSPDSRIQELFLTSYLFKKHLNFNITPISLPAADFPSL